MKSKYILIETEETPKRNLVGRLVILEKKAQINYKNNKKHNC